MMKKRAFLFVVLAGLLWGSTGIFSQSLADYGFTGLRATAVRGATSFILVLLYVLAFKREMLRVKLSELALFFGIGFALFGTSTAYFYAIPRTSNATAVVLMYTSPVIVAVISALFLGERFSRLKIFSVIIMLLGCVLVSGVIGNLKVDFIGILLGLLASVGYASYNIITKIAIKRGAEPLSATLYGFGFMTLLSLLLCEPQKILSSASADPFPVIPLMIGIGLVTCVAPYVLYNSAMKTLPAGTACALSIVEPMSATVYCMMLYGEYPAPLPAVGIVLILSAVFLLGRAKEDGETNDKKDKEEKI